MRKSVWYAILVTWFFLVLAVTLVYGQQHYPPTHQHPSRQEDGRCPDGHFHIDCEDGAPQPDMCDNGFKNEHPCQCEVATDTVCDPQAHAKPGKKCKTYCREKACGCLSMCTS